MFPSLPALRRRSLRYALQTSIIATYALARCLGASWIEASVTKVGQGFGKVLKVLGVTPVSAEPGEGALDHPAARQDDEALHVVAPLDDRQALSRHLCHGSVNLPGVVAAIGPDQFEPREAPAAPLFQFADVGLASAVLCRRSWFVVMTIIKLP